MKRTGFTVLAIAGLLWFAIFSISRRPYSCSVCRAKKVKTFCLGLQWSQEEEETECSRWYRSYVERVHSHLWQPSRHCDRIGIPGLWVGYACYGGSLIDYLPEATQIEIYQHFADRLEAKALFTRLGRREEKHIRILEAITDWSLQGYPGTWREWWERTKNNPAP